MKTTRPRGRPKKKGGALTAKERMSRQRQRRSIFIEELERHGLSQQVVCVDNLLFSELKSIAKDHENCSVHDLMFLAMRHYLNYLSVDKPFKNYQFNLNRAINSATQIAVDQGLDGLFSAAHVEVSDLQQTKGGT